MSESKNWRELFNVEQVEKPFNIQTEPGECNANCQMAKELVCRCRCGGKNHSAALRKNVRSLDDFSEKETVEDPVEASFSPEEYLEEMVLA
jgi:hypothetical protein